MRDGSRPLSRCFCHVVLTGSDGFTRQVSTGPDGTFAFRDLPSGSNYKVSVTAPSFMPVEQPGISVAIGRTTQLALTLSLGAANEIVSVTAQLSPLDTDQTSSVVNIDRDRIEELPIPSRNYQSFVQLSPQAAPANPTLSQNTLTQGGGTLAFSFGGIRPGSNSVRIDGVDDDDEFSGSSRTQLSPEAINDFQIVNHGFRAQSGGAVDVQTRAGLNSPHGDVFLFALNGTPPLGIHPRKPDESRFRAGIALGAALQPDRTFFYVAAEQELARGEEANDLQPGTIALINTAFQQTGPLKGFSLSSGFFRTTDQETELSGRLDRVLTSQQNLMVRYAFTNARNVDDAFHTDELTDRSARGSSFVADNSVDATLTSTLGGPRVNSLRLELSLRRAVERTENQALQECSFQVSPSSVHRSRATAVASRRTSMGRTRSSSSVDIIFCRQVSVWSMLRSERRCSMASADSSSFLLLRRFRQAMPTSSPALLVAPPQTSQLSRGFGTGTAGTVRESDRTRHLPQRRAASVLFLLNHDGGDTSVRHSRRTTP